MVIIVNLCTRKDSDYKKYWNDKFFSYVLEITQLRITNKEYRDLFESSQWEYLRPCCNYSRNGSMQQVEKEG